MAFAARFLPLVFFPGAHAPWRPRDLLVTSKWPPGVSFGLCPRASTRWRSPWAEAINEFPEINLLCVCGLSVRPCGSHVSQAISEPCRRWMTCFFFLLLLSFALVSRLFHSGFGRCAESQILVRLMFEIGVLKELRCISLWAGERKTLRHAERP